MLCPDDPGAAFSAAQRATLNDEEVERLKARVATIAATIRSRTLGTLVDGLSTTKARSYTVEASRANIMGGHAALELVMTGGGNATGVTPKLTSAASGRLSRQLSTRSVANPNNENDTNPGPERLGLQSPVAAGVRRNSLTSPRPLARQRSLETIGSEGGSPAHADSRGAGPAPAVNATPGLSAPRLQPAPVPARRAGAQEAPLLRSTSSPIRASSAARAAQPLTHRERGDAADAAAGRGSAVAGPARCGSAAGSAASSSGSSGADGSSGACGSADSHRMRALVRRHSLPHSAASASGTPFSPTATAGKEGASEGPGGAPRLGSG